MMKLMSLKQYMKMSKPALIRKITKTLRAMPKKRLAVVCYNITKAKLPRLKVIKRKALPKRKTKRKFSRKQLAAQRLFAKRARAGTLKRRRR
jgi:D-mannonate dehydratase